jgi:hypothetical protein
MREIGPLKPHYDPGEVFYTIRKEDVGKQVIETEIGKIDVGTTLGRVITADIGRRLYRKNLGDSGYTWQAENNAQRRKREGKS